MERRFLTKALWATAVVMMAIGALGQDILADKPLPPPDFCTTTLICSDKGFVEADAVTQVREAGRIVTRQDVHVGRACYSVLREFTLNVPDLQVELSSAEIDFVVMHIHASGEDCR